MIVEVSRRTAEDKGDTEPFPALDNTERGKVFRELQKLDTSVSIYYPRVTVDASPETLSYDDLVKNMVRKAEDDCWKHLSKTELTSFHNDVASVMHTVCAIMSKEFTQEATRRVSLLHPGTFSEYFKAKRVMEEMDNIFEPDVSSNLKKLGATLVQTTKRSFIKPIEFSDNVLRYKIELIK